MSGILYSKIRTLEDPLIHATLNNLSPYQIWLLNPDSFNYELFKIDWVRLSNDKMLLEHLGKSSKLKDVIINELRLNPNQQLSQSLAQMLLQTAV